MDRLRLHHGHVLGAVAEQPGGQGDPGVAAADDQHVVVLHRFLHVTTGTPLPVVPTVFLWSFLRLAACAHPSDGSLEDLRLLPPFYAAFVLALRDLNRTLLVRQHLLERVTVPPLPWSST